MPPSTDDLEAADDELWAALRHGDADAIEAIADPELTLDHEVFGDLDLDGLLHRLRHGTLDLQEVALERRRLRITGELATTVSIVTVSGTHEGAPFRARLRWVRTWRLAAAWILVAASSAPVREAGTMQHGRSPGTPPTGATRAADGSA